MGWHYIIVVVMAWMITSYCFHNTRKKHMDTIFNLQTALQDPDTARRIMGKHLPAWLCFSQPEKTAWLQTLINNMWPNIAEAVRNDVMASVNVLLESYRPKMILNSLKLSVFQLGDIPIVIDGVSASLSGNDSVIDLFFHWNGNSDIHLVAEALGGVEVEAVICNLQYQSVARIFLGPHCSAWPCFGCFSVTFVGKPVLDFNIKAAKIPLEAIPGFSSWLRGFVEQMLAWSLTYPNRLVFPLFSDVGSMRLMERTVDPIGRLTVRIIEAQEIPETFFQTRKTYVQGTRSNGDPKTAVTKRTSKSITGKNPKYDETISFSVYNAPNERIELALMADETKPPVIGNMLIKDNVIGFMILSVSSLLDGGQEGRTLKVSKRLVNPAKTTANVGSLTVETTFSPFVNQDDNDMLGEADDAIGAAMFGEEDSSGALVMSENPTLEEAARNAPSVSGLSSANFGASSASFEPGNPTGVRKRSSSAGKLRRSIVTGKAIRGLLVVNIISCANLPKIDMIGSSDPYVKLRLHNQMEQTAHVKDNLNPVFNVQKQFDVNDVVRDIGSSDPYVKLRLHNQMEQTAHVKDNLNPVFNVQKQFDVNDVVRDLNPVFNVQKQFDVNDVVRDVLEVEVHDYDRIKVNKRLLGAVNIDVKSVFEAGSNVLQKSYQLSGRGGGSILLGLKLLVNQE
ncbi:Ca2+-dependent lipid binding protein, putative [Bodo saltans]|uniref:Ca2+-dependent lipid binding protein, putative n=1 Tax=Bodo saltans TaxID=75058 RepID=A0A0S4JGB8_BODSA|nr:Ca2+-dependent lipid binding protein, putative [Bodo saltans]|eukprot:CUG88487.1 Ca2+-dependent lipid binding protein, putative [Bodo saltans]